MSADLYLLFRKGAAEAVDAPALDGYVAQLVRCPGVVAARPFTVNVVLGDRTPAFYPDLVICERDRTIHDAGLATVAPITGSVPGAADRDGLRFAAWEGVSIGARRDIELSGHLYLQFSAHPPSLTFDAYSDWYQVHQDENIAQSAVLRRGWRYRLEPPGTAEIPGPTHLALYELEGTLERLTADLAGAMQAGAISLPDWFARFASLEAIAVGERVTG
jgi:hypothetical protein